MFLQEFIDHIFAFGSIRCYANRIGVSAFGRNDKVQGFGRVMVPR